MKISNLKVGQILKEGINECIIISTSNDKFEVQYSSGVCWTYSQQNLDNNELETYIG